MTRKHLIVELAFLCLLAVLWGSSYLFINIAVQTIPPFTLVFLRVFLASSILAIVMVLRGYKFPRDPKDLKLLAVQGLLGGSLAWVLLSWGQQYTASALASVLNSTSPIFVFFATWIFTKHEVSNIRRLIGAILGLGGVIIIVGVEAMAGLGTAVLAQLAIVGGAISYAFASIWGQRLRHLPSLTSATCVMLFSTAYLLPLSLIFEAPWALRPSSNSIIAIVTLPIVCTAVASLIYYRLLKTLGSLGTASQAYLRAGVGVALGVIILGESISMDVALGLVLAVLGVLLINWPIKSTPRGSDMDAGVTK